MEPERARELLATERSRIEQALARLGHQDTGEPADEDDPADEASDLWAFSEVANLPARLTYQAGALPFGCKVEVQAIAARP
jgi:enamine deaminase RidA (YjgF/YER057c/UK114 family)